MQLWNSSFQCHNSYYSYKITIFSLQFSASSLKYRKWKKKIVIINFHESLVLHNFLWWLSFKYKFKGGCSIAQNWENWRQSPILRATDFDFCKKGQIFFSPGTTMQHIFVLICLSVQILFFLTLKNRDCTDMVFKRYQLR